MAVSSDSLGLVGGHVVHRGRQQVWRGQFENYIPYPGIRAGANSVAVVVEHLPFDDAHASRAVVFPDSALVYAPISPAKLAIHLHLPTSAQAERRVPVQITVENLGGHRTVAGKVALHVLDDAGIGERTAPLPPLGGGRSRTITFYVRPKKPGKFRLVAAAQTGLSNPQETETLHVVARSVDAASRFAWWWIPLAIVFIGLAMASARVRQRRRPGTSR